MLFYLVLGGLFTVYALDLLFLVVVAFIARSAEVATLLRKQASERKLKRLSSSTGKKGKKAGDEDDDGKGAAEGTATVITVTAEPAGPLVAASGGGGAAGARSGRDSHHALTHSIRRGGGGGGGGGGGPLEPTISGASSDDAVQISECSEDVSGDDLAATAGFGGRRLAGSLAVHHRSNNTSHGIEDDYDEDSYGGGSSGGNAAGRGGGRAVPAASAGGVGGGSSGRSKAVLTMLPSGPLEPSADPYKGSPFPKVLVQLPMYNEEAHCQSILTNCCGMTWPRERLLIQLLDDSTKEAVRKKVDDAAAQAIENGHPVQVLRRDNRSGFKAGAMVEGLNRVEGQGFEYCAIFDADFDPPHDFLLETISRLHMDRRLAYVQTRWAFANGNESFLTWVQKVNLSFHFDVEQRARSFLGWFFNFNGTAGVWRIQAIHDAGGWQSDTVVEDMDLSLRCYLRGWTGLYLPWVDNPNEVPSTLSSYKTQQFRWLSGPMQILLKSFHNIWTARSIPFTKRLNCYWFFMRYILFAAITLGVLAVPPVVMWVDKFEWKWPQIYFVVSINFALAVYIYVTPFSIAYLVFSIAVGYFKLYAMINGLVGGKKSKTWKVTQKYGAKQGGAGGLLRNFHKPYALELCLALYYAGMGAGAGVLRDWIMLGYCSAMALIFCFLAFGDMYM